ncbi:MAG: hypothetical protein HZC54_11480 [Verrucomicrobia bacterium]|nr:hypothetical protein [Verrucomicrobiota bacterium]
MRADALRELRNPPAELAARVMGDVRAWQRPPSVTWLVGGQTAVLAALLFASTASLPEQMVATTETVRDWSVSVAMATLELSDRVGEFVGVREIEEIL